MVIVVAAAGTAAASMRTPNPADKTTDRMFIDSTQEKIIETERKGTQS
jgi:hypothetical protein